MKYTFGALFFALACSTSAGAQPTLDPAGAPNSISLKVASGTPLRVALENEIAIQKVGQPIRGRIVEPVYAFDQIAVPVGSEVVGKITGIEKTSKEKRAEALLNADLTPERGVTENGLICGRQQIESSALLYSYSRQFQTLVYHPV